MNIFSKCLEWKIGWYSYLPGISGLTLSRLSRATSSSRSSYSFLGVTLHWRNNLKMTPSMPDGKHKKQTTSRFILFRNLILLVGRFISIASVSSDNAVGLCKVHISTSMTDQTAVNSWTGQHKHTRKRTTTTYVKSFVLERCWQCGTRNVMSLITSGEFPQPISYLGHENKPLHVLSLPPATFCQQERTICPGFNYRSKWVLTRLSTSTPSLDPNIEQNHRQNQLLHREKSFKLECFLCLFGNMKIDY